MECWLVQFTQLCCRWVLGIVHDTHIDWLACIGKVLGEFKRRWGRGNMYCKSTTWHELELMWDRKSIQFYGTPFSFLFLGYTKFWCWQEEEEYTKTCTDRNSVAILKEYFQYPCWWLSRNIDQVPRRRRRRRFMRLACWLEGVHLLQTKNFQEKRSSLCLFLLKNLLYH